MDIINAHDDYGSSDRMLMSPDTWRRLIKPNLKRMVDAVHDMGLIYQHHSCGCIDPIEAKKHLAGYQTVYGSLLPAQLFV